jgi:2-oxoglutarate dehydrogenase complex dehydrogenase (E1) component-like enzyme
MDPPKLPAFERVVFCSGKIYYELAAERAKQGKESRVALCRVEQVSSLAFLLSPIAPLGAHTPGDAKGSADL